MDLVSEINVYIILLLLKHPAQTVYLCQILLKIRLSVQLPAGTSM